MHRVVVSAFVLAASIAGGFSSVARADQFSLSIGGGHGHHRHHGHHHHYHHRHYGPSWGFSYWSPPPPRYVYVAPAPVIQERIYVQPPVVQQPVIIQQPAASYSSAPANVTSAPSLPSPPTRTASSGQPVVIRNTNGKNVPVAFLVDDRSEELRDGQARSFSGSSHIIEFDRGGDLGTARYELTSGVYAFTVTDRGWELVRETSSGARTADRPALKKNDLPEVR